MDEDDFNGVDMGLMRNRGDRFERWGRNNHGDEIDGNMSNIKMAILQFKGRSDPGRI